MQQSLHLSCDLQTGRLRWLVGGAAAMKSSFRKGLQSAYIFWYCCNVMECSVADFRADVEKNERAEVETNFAHGAEQEDEGAAKHRD
jgi:hypothetical protein